MIINTLLILFAIAFAVNMGGSNFAASFAPSFGGKALGKLWCQILFTVFVFLGAVCMGGAVATTLGKNLVPQSILHADTVMIILASSTIGLLVANLIRVPQSTSFVTVFSILGVGTYFKSVNQAPFFVLIPLWFVLPILGYGITYFIGKMVYPPRKGNLWLYEKLIHHQHRLKIFVNLASCYNAFSVGTNNVANAVGPLLGAGLISGRAGLALLAPAFGVGGFIFHKSLNTTSEQIVPFGVFTASLMSVVSGTLMLVASLLGVPQSFVMLKMACLFALSSVKDGHEVTFSNPITRKTYITWAVMPIVCYFIALGLTAIRYKVFK